MKELAAAALVGVMMSSTRHRLDCASVREWIMRGFIRAEDAVYVGLGTVLAAMALALLGTWRSPSRARCWPTRCQACRAVARPAAPES